MTRETVARKRTRMCRRHFVMWELQVSTTGLDGDGCGSGRACKRLQGNHGAFNMPTGSPGTNLRVPGRFVFSSRAPEQWIKRTALAFAFRISAKLYEPFRQLRR